MISIRQSALALDRLEELLQACATSYGLALRSTAQYAIEIEPTQAGIFRQHLEVLHTEVQNATTREHWQSIQASFRGELRDHRDRVAEQLGRLRGEMKAAADAMQSFADSVAASGGLHEQELSSALGKLESAAQSASRASDLEQVRREIASAVGVISASVEQMRRSHQMVIAQLHDEIRTLHHQMEEQRHAQLRDQASGVWNRAKLDQVIGGLVENDQAFSILLIRVRNLKRLEGHHSRAVLDGALRALLQRFATLVGNEASIGRWEENEFIAIVERDRSSIIALSREASRRLSGGYSVQENGISQNVQLNVAAGIVERTHGMSWSSILPKLQQMSEALALG